MDSTVHHGLEGVVAFETEIAEPDKAGSPLRYRGRCSEVREGQCRVRVIRYMAPIELRER